MAMAYSFSDRWFIALCASLSKSDIIGMIALWCESLLLVTPLQRVLQEDSEGGKLHEIHDSNVVEC